MQDLPWFGHLSKKCSQNQTGVIWGLFFQDYSLAIHKNSQKFTNIHKYSQIFTNIHKYSQIFTKTYTPAYHVFFRLVVNFREFL